MHTKNARIDSMGCKGYVGLKEIIDFVKCVSVDNSVAMLRLLASGVISTYCVGCAFAEPLGA